MNAKEVLLHLSKIYVVEDNFRSEILSEFSKKKARTILEKMEIDPLLKSEYQGSVKYVVVNFGL